MIAGCSVPPICGTSTHNEGPLGRPAHAGSSRLNSNALKVYILYSPSAKKYYVGQTQNLENRLQRHNNCSVPSTKYGAPWKLILTFDVPNRSEALRLEKKIKGRGIKRFLNDRGM